MSDTRPLVVISRVLLPAGLDPLKQRYEVREGGLDATRDDLLEMAPGATAIVADPSVRIDDEVLVAAGPSLKLVANFAVGHDNIDLEACRQRGVIASNTPNVLTEATAELALALTLAAARRMSDAERDLREGRWSGWDPAAYRGLELRGATVGVVGLGRIGRRYAGLVHALGAHVVYTANTSKPASERQLDARPMELEGLLVMSDVVSLHVPATPETHHLIGERELGLMRHDAVLVNTSRGPLVDSEALAKALNEGSLGAAGLDVYESEPEVPESLLKAPRAVLLPHIGSASVPARDAMALMVADNVIAVLEGGEPPSPIY